jgi:hypothetical protein
MDGAMHGMCELMQYGMAGEWHGMCELALMHPPKLSNKHIQMSICYFMV